MLAMSASAAVDARALALEGRKTQWAPTRNSSELNARAVFASESRRAASPYAGEGGGTAAGSGEARYYDSKLGVFLSRDSFEGVLSEAPSLHRFTYAHNRPLKYRDPNGRFVEELIRMLSRPPMPQDDPSVAAVRSTVEGAPGVVAQTYETGVGGTIVDPAHSAVSGAVESAAYGSMAPLRAVGADSYASANSAGISAVGQFAVDAVFGVVNLVTRPYKIVEGLARLPGEFTKGVSVAADSGQNIDARIKGASRALGAASQLALMAFGSLKAVGVEGPAVSLGRGPAATMTSGSKSFMATGADVELGQGFTRIGGDKASVAVADYVAREPELHDVIVHGKPNFEQGKAVFSVSPTPSSSGLPTHANQIAEQVLLNPSYSPGQPVRLLTCWGACGPAQELSNILRAPVHASTFEVGIRRLAPNEPAVTFENPATGEPGRWLRFDPEESAAKK